MPNDPSSTAPADTAPGPLRRFAGRRVLVTGASRGIGAGVALRLAAEGAAVAVVARTAEPGGPLPGSLADTASHIAALGGTAVPLTADLSDEHDRSAVVQRAADALEGPIDVLVNNAAAAIYAPLAEMPLRRRRLMFEMNVHAPLDLAQAAIPAMAAAGEGWIVNLSSGSAKHWPGPPFELGVTGSTIAEYGASKAALERLTNGLAAELVDRGIRVNAVAPRAAVRTEGADALLGDRLRADQLESLEHMVEAVVALCCAPTELTGTCSTSHEVLARLGLPVRTLDAATLVDPDQDRG
jgi:NAD(P)-dependent dehydrogenase (short-subunit alcohol dehydrogenase family)